MNILMICTEKLPVPPVRGGAIQTYIDGVSPLLSKRHKLTILSVDDPILPNKQTLAGVDYVRVPGKLPDIYIQHIVAYLKNNASKYDLIHVFNRPKFIPPIRSVAPNARLILSMHNDMFLLEKIDPPTAVAAIDSLEKIVTVSNYVGQTIAKLYPQAQPKLKTIYSGVDIKRYIPSSEAERKKERDALRRQHKLQGKKVILFVGRLTAKKGVDRLVLAMKSLKKKHSDIALVLVGSKWYSDEGVSDYVAYVHALAKRCPVPVITTGFVDPKQVHKWFWAGDVFVCTSLWQEPLARVHYEAMAAGLPIVTTARGGNPEVIQSRENGLIVQNPENPEEFTRAISTILSSDTMRRHMGVTGKKLAIRNYGFERVANDILSVWEKKN
ncbi:glycosyltransferase family 4 protein [Shimazuella sp. AN120528]|uniref:glycosyltransferase family 4 protein n=1 Tax=Shimazuella soli TaxID=1892854 RepID=UPI001F114902|nr:glycosyltransferase family 4 protein [Shimazuella soli]MCH5583811.1 glycosyltransferase family 4 protein [Shimazuella soli]